MYDRKIWLDDQLNDTLQVKLYPAEIGSLKRSYKIISEHFRVESVSVKQILKNPQSFLNDLESYVNNKIITVKQGSYPTLTLEMKRRVVFELLGNFVKYLVELNNQSN